MNENIKLFKSYYANLLIPNGFLFRDGKFVRVIPNIGAIFVYLRSRKTIHNILVSVVSFAQEYMSIQELIRNNDVDIWTLRRKFLNYKFQYDSISEFLAQSLHVFKLTVYPDVIKISNAKDILMFYIHILDEYSINDAVWYNDVRIASSMHSQAYEYTLKRIDILEEHIRSKLNQNHDFDDVCNMDLSKRLDLRLQKLNLIRDIIHNNDASYINQFINERVNYWNDIFKSRYAPFF